MLCTNPFIKSYVTSPSKPLPAQHSKASANLGIQHCIHFQRNSTHYPLRALPGSPIMPCGPDLACMVVGVARVSEAAVHGKWGTYMWPEPLMHPVTPTPAPTQPPFDQKHRHAHTICTLSAHLLAQTRA